MKKEEMFKAFSIKAFTVSFVIELVFLHLACSTPSVSVAETLTLSPIACKCVSNTGVRPVDLVVCFDGERNEWISYIAFNLSEIPSWVSIDYAIFEIKAQYVYESTRISAYCSSDAEWIESTMTWMTKPELDKYLGEQWVSAPEEWYSWNYSTLEIYGCALIDVVLNALAETGILTIQLRSGFMGYLDHTIIRVSQVGHVIFYSDAKLDITYAHTDTSAPTFGAIDIQPSNPTAEDEVTVSAIITDDKSGVKEAYLYYSTDGGANWVKVPISSIGDSKYEATIPGQKEDTTVQYYVEAFDNALNKAESEIKSYTIKSSARILPYGFISIMIIILFGIFVVIGVLIYCSGKKRKIEQIAFSFFKFLK